MSGKFCFAIDRGGTFTDVFAYCPDGEVRTLKLLSEDPVNYRDAPTEGIRRILEEKTGIQIPRWMKIDSSNIKWIRMGTTIATNALLERKGEKTALVINKGFKDLLYIGNQARPKIFDLEIAKPKMLYERVIEVDCRIIPESEGKCLLTEKENWNIVEGLSGERFYCVSPVAIEDVTNQLKPLLEEGFKSIAVVLMHSYMYHEHELEIGNIAKALGFTNVSLSHEVMPMARIVNRGYTACADAYLTPHIRKYLKGFSSGFENNLSDVNVLFMQSDGGLTPMNQFNGSRAVLSGPAGGVVGYATTTPGDQPTIGFDMGGTSTDVSRFSGKYEHIFESTVAGITIQAPQLDINTVAAGGGSRLFFRSGLFVVGPESAGALPGPVCYRRGGYLTITDANLVLGRVLPEYFPKIFGPKENEPLDLLSTIEAFDTLGIEINDFLRSQGKPKMSLAEIALGYIRVANEAMCRPIRALTQGKGYETRTHTLACFGGAGGQHACAVARELGISKVFVHKYAGILSAYGMACADVVNEEQEPSSLYFVEENFGHFANRFAFLKSECSRKLRHLGFDSENISCELFLNMRYEGTDGSLMVTSQSNDFRQFLETFTRRYENEFGFKMPGRSIVVDDIRVRGIGKTLMEKVESQNDYRSVRLEATKVIKYRHHVREMWNTTPKRNVAYARSFQSQGEFPRQTFTQVYFENGGHLETKIFLMNDLVYGDRICGPSIIIDDLSTIIIEPNCVASLDLKGNIIIEINSIERQNVGTELDAIQLSIFSHRFMSIAEQMGRVLQRTAISTNIKERLDFSCALFGPDGGLVSNAPHIPVHLGSMQEAVQYQINNLGDEIKAGDVILSNHPEAGGSHLPDLTVITPVFHPSTRKAVFFVASRGHHADIGGISPGSMPPHSKCLGEEGATFKSFFLVRNGSFMEKEVTEELMKPAQYPNSSGTRNLQDNLADLKAQVAANHKGILLVNQLIDTYGLDVVQAYMKHIQDNAAFAVRDMLKSIGQRHCTGSEIVSMQAEDFLDCGSRISIKVDIDIKEGTAVCDFTGSECEVWGNLNAPKAITLSALIYCLRCMVGYDVPLNQGCLNPIKVIIPSGTILNPSGNAAVVGGNVLTSQRVVDVILKAFNVCAASQGCMNNITFGQNSWGYYETVAGGAGAGPTWSGRSGVHTHMTNTRITDPEILERRYPVILVTFSLRDGSGGAGINRGGDGVIREIKFRSHISLSILTERRVFSPYGLEGGNPGVKGRNHLYKNDGRIISLGSKTAAEVEPGDCFRLETPGGGGWGKG